MAKCSADFQVCCLPAPSDLPAAPSAAQAGARQAGVVGFQTRWRPDPIHTPPTWKSAIPACAARAGKGAAGRQQVWKPALLYVSGRVGSAVALSLISIAPLLGLGQNARAADTPLDAPPVETVISRDAHSKVIETSRAVLDKDGKLTIRKGQYTVLQTGMNRLVNGEYIESRALVESYPSGAIANQASHQAIFSKNLLAEGGTVDLLTPDGKRLRAVPVGLGWKNAKTGQFAWIARAKDTAGAIQSPATVVYENAFDSLRANVVVSYTTAGLEAWVVLKENPILPEGFAPDSTLFQVITEFLEVPAAASEKVITRHTPAPALTENWVEPELTDVFTDWGAMQLWPGRAFPLTPSGEKTNSFQSRVFKYWERANGRTLLFESLPYPSIRSELEQLPKQTAQAKPAVRDRFEWAALPVSAQPKGAMKVASVKSEGPGFAVDWTVVTSQYTYTFYNGYTYKLQGPVYISQSATFQSGAILKYTTVDFGGANGYLEVMGTITGPSQYQPCAYFTHVEDNTVGEPLGGDQLGAKYPYALYLNLNNSTVLQRLEIRSAALGIWASYLGANPLYAQDCVFKSCTTGIAALYSTVYVSRTFMCSVETPTYPMTGGSFPSPNFTRTCDDVNVAPSIPANEPANANREVGYNVTFTVAATGFALNFQWFYNNRSIAGASGPSYTISNVQHAHAGEYYVVVENEVAQATSRRATLTVDGRPTITVPPQDQSVPLDSKVTFSIEAIGTPLYNGIPDTPFYYQWYKPGGTLVQSGTSHELVVDPVQQGHNGMWHVTVQNGYTGGPNTADYDFYLTVEQQIDRIYTYSADFDHGIRINLNHNVANQLQINSDPTPLPYINVPCSGSIETPYGRGTLARINVNSGQIVGEYYTAPVQYSGQPADRLNPNPSRTAVDRFGNCWIANRDDDTGSITKFGIVIGGIRCTRSGATPPYTFVARRDGEFLRPPFAYNTCVDKDGDGAIRTSRGLRHVLSWSAATPDEPEDEAILKYVRVDCPGTRALAVDTNNNVWVGGIGQGFAGMHQNIHGETGEILWTSNPALPSGGYVGVINDVAGERWLWSSYPSSEGIPGHPVLLRLKLSNKTYYTMPTGNNWMGDYGLAVDPKHHDIWVSKNPGSTLAKYTNNGSGVQTFPGRSPIGRHQGLVVDNHDNVWVAHCKYTVVDPAANTVGHLLTNGHWVGNVNLTSTSANRPGPTGVSIDSNQKVWVANFDSNNVMRINPNAGPYSGEFNQWRVGQVDLVVNLENQFEYPNGKAANPYAMSDMSGFVNLAATYPCGVWIIVQDGGVENRAWYKISWNGFTTPPETGITVEVRAANSIVGLPGSRTTLNSFRTVTSDEPFNPAVTGRYLEVRVTLWRNPTTSNRPLLYDLTVHPTD